MSTASHPHSAKGRLAFLGVACVLGIASGTIASIVIGGWSRDRAAKPGREAIELNRPTGDEGVATMPSAPATLEPKISRAAGEKQMVRLEANGAPPSAANGALQKRPSRQVALKEIYEMEKRKVSDHYNEPIDASWAKRATPALRSDLTKLAQDKAFRLKDVDCRNETCIAEVEWPTYDAAHQSYTDLATANLEVNCARTVVLPDPSDKAAPLTARMILDCKGWKGGGSQFLSSLSNRSESPQPQAAQR